MCLSLGLTRSTRQLPPSPCLLGTPPTRSQGLSPFAGLFSLPTPTPGGPSAPRAAARALGGARWAAPLARPASVGACSPPGLRMWSPVTRSPAIFLQVRTGGAAGPWPHLFPCYQPGQPFLPLGLCLCCQPPGTLSHITVCEAFATHKVRLWTASPGSPVSPLGGSIPYPTPVAHCNCCHS